jgi:hypothetical protein
MWRLESPPDRDSLAADPWVLMVVVRNLMAGRAIRARPDLVPLHASVVERGGFYLALSGPAKAGKTTLVIEMLPRGWRLVSDDLAPIDPRTGVALPFPKPLQVRDPGRWRKFATGWDVPRWLPPPAVAALVPPSAVELAPQTPYRPDVIAFSRWDPRSDPVLERLGPAEAAALCLQNLQDDRDARTVLGPLAQLCRAAAAVRLVYPSSGAAFGLLRPLLQD